jgi:hypothetical protein
MENRTAVRLQVRRKIFSTRVTQAERDREEIARAEHRNPHPRLPATAGAGADLASKVAEEANQNDKGDRNTQQQQYD